MEEQIEDQQFQKQQSEEQHYEIGTKCKTHGAAIQKWTGKQPCVFDSTRKCVSSNAGDCSKLISAEVRDPRNLPLKRDWRLVSKDKRNKHGGEPDPVTFFRATHTQKDQTWIDETSQQRKASIERQVQRMVNSGEKDTPELRTQVYVEAMGSETRNRVQGYDHGVTPEMVSTASSSKKSSTGALAKLLSENNELRMREEKATKQLVEVQAQLLQSQTLQQQINQQQQHINQQMMQQQQLLMMLMIHLQRPPQNPQATQHLAPNQPPLPSYPLHQMPLQQPMSYMQHPPFQMPVYRP